jgi:Fe-S oxidoreductase
MLKQAKRTLRGLLDTLEQYIDAGVPIVVPEPSCLAAFRDELPALLAEDPRAAKLAGLARSPAEHLLTLDPADLAPLAELSEGASADRAGAAPESADRAGSTAPGLPRVLLHPHCHARAVHAVDADRRLLELLGYQVEVLDAGCCGLAGSFGFTAAHESVSRTIGEDQWLPKIAAALWDGQGRSRVVIDGFSCATQYRHLAHPTALRPVTLAELIGGSE